MCEMYSPFLNFCMKANQMQIDKQIASNSYKNLVY